MHHPSSAQEAIRCTSRTVSRSRKKQEPKQNMSISMNMAMHGLCMGRLPRESMPLRDWIRGKGFIPMKESVSIPRKSYMRKREMQASDLRSMAPPQPCVCPCINLVRCWSHGGGSYGTPKPNLTSRHMVIFRLRFSNFSFLSLV